MAIFVDQVLDVHAVEAIKAVLEKQEVFEDGKKTAGHTAKKVKHNLQANSEEASVGGALKMVEQALMTNPIFKSAALPLRFSKIMFSRYEKGMTYGAHIDDPFIEGVRTDLSFTLFLSEPEAYEGGDLVVKRYDGDESVKLPAGALYLYPSTSLHFVAPVTSGCRLVAVGWLQSRVRSAEQREILFDLAQALRSLPNSEANSVARLDLLKTQANLMRMWAD